MKNTGLLRGIIFLVIGIFLVYWAESHSPKKLGQMLGNQISGSYTLSEPWYYVCLGLGIVIGIMGVLRTYKSMK